MPRRDWIEERLQNWARWKLGGGGDDNLGYNGVRPGDADGGRSGYITAAVPLLSAEAAETDTAVQLLYPGGLRLTVIEFYVGTGNVRDKAERLVCAVPTLYRRIEQAHDQLAEHWLAHQDKRKAERLRIEALGRGSFTR